MFERLLLSLPIFVGEVVKFVVIVAIVGSISFYIGQLLPRRSFDYRNPPYSPYAWEKGGTIYTKVGIQCWKDKVPDMSHYVKSSFRKKITVFRSAEYLEILVLETCVAEFVHWALILVSPVFLIYMDGVGGWIGMGLYVVGNLPFIAIQRYNRPRLVQLLERQEKREAAEARKKAREKAESTTKS